MTAELSAHFLNLYSMALTDSAFDEKEIAVLYKLGEERGIPKETIDTMLLSPPGPDELTLPNTLYEKMEYLYDYARMIMADGIVHADELATLEKFCIKFQFESKNIPTITEFLLEAARNNVAKKELLEFVTQQN